MGGLGRCSVIADENKILIITIQATKFELLLILYGLNVIIKPQLSSTLTLYQLWQTILISLNPKFLVDAFYTQGVFG